MALRVLHCPVNLAGVGWTNVQALRRRGIDARLLLFRRAPHRPEQGDIFLELPGKNRVQRLATQTRAFLQVLPQTDIFHFYFGLTLIPKRLQFPALRLTRKRSVFHFLGADIRDRPRHELRYGLMADARVVGSFDALRYVPFDAHVLPPGIEVDRYTPAFPEEHERPVRVVHAPSSREKKGTEHIVEACRKLPVELDVVEKVHNREALRRYAEADIVVDQLYRGWHGVFTIEAMALGKPVVTSLNADAVRQTEAAFGVEVPIVPATIDDLAERLQPLIQSAELRRRLGEAGRAYVERVHDIERVTDRLVGVYEGL